MANVNMEKDHQPSTLAVPYSIIGIYLYNTNKKLVVAA
jgi:hypothetical protein